LESVVDGPEGSGKSVRDVSLTVSGRDGVLREDDRFPGSFRNAEALLLPLSLPHD